MKKNLFVFVAFLLAFINADAQKWNPTYSNVDYVGDGSSKHMLDIYIPTGVSAPTATIVHIHGGAFLMGSKGVSEQPSFQNLFNNGYICVDINYRYSSDSIWPAQVHDCKAAIRYLKANAALYNIDTCKIGVIGESAGGYLVSMLGTSGQVSSLEGLHFGNAHVTSRVHAVVDLFGPINFLTMDAEAAALGFTINTNAATSPESRLMGAPVQTIPELVTLANPTTYISSDDAAFFISAGSQDMNIPYTQGQNLCNALVPAIGSSKASFELIAGAGHGGSVWHNSTQDAKYLAFFNESLTGCDPTGTSFNCITKEKLVVSPNPATENFFLTMPADQQYAVSVINQLGAVVHSSDYMGNQIKVDCSNLPAGFYIVKASSASKVYTALLIKQ